MWSELFVDGAPQFPQYKVPGVSWEATVYGNRVGDTYTVGLVYITQSSVRFLQGFVNSIDLSTGEFCKFICSCFAFLYRDVSLPYLNYLRNGTLMAKCPPKMPANSET